MKGRLTGPPRGQQGLASIVVVSVLIVILSLISLGFARLISRSAVNSANRQFSASATYAALSGINDVAAYLKKYATDPANKNSNLLPQSTTCTGAGSLLSGGTPQGPFFKYSSLSNDTASSTKYTCLLLNPTPKDLVFTQVLNLKSQVVKLNTSAAAGAFEKLMISWQPSCDPTNPNICQTGYPVNVNSLYDETTWNSTTANCKDGASNAGCVPVLRVTMFPISNGETLSSAQAQSKTVFLYPRGPVGNVSQYSYTDNTNFKDGSILPIPCTQTVTPNTFSPSTKSDYKCNVIVTSLATALGVGNNTDSVYLRLTPIYNQADIKIQANDKYGNALNFLYDQAIVDVTAQTGGVTKRLQGRVDISNLAPNINGVDTSISPNSDSIPEQSVRSANALCKREIQVVSPGGTFSNYVSFSDEPDEVCHNSAGTDNPVPSLTFNITGPDWNGSGYTNQTRDSEELTPPGSVSTGTLYTQPNNSVTLGWTTKDATSCTASGGVAGWDGDKTSLMTFSGSPKINGSGSQTISAPGSITEYNLQCNRVGAPGPSAIKKVRIWPAPTATLTGPASITAGSPYTISWASTNSSSCDLTGDWKTTGTINNGSGVPIGNSQTMTDTLTDNKDKTFTITCKDPINRTATKSLPYKVGCSDASCGKKLPPPCTATTSATPGDAAVNYSWSGACPTADPTAGYYKVTSSTDASWFSSNRASGNGTTPGFRANEFCLTLTVGLLPWGDLGTSTSCATPTKPGDNNTPACTASLTPYDNGNGTGGFKWSGACPPVNPGRGYYQFYNCVNYNCNSIGIFGDGSVGQTGPDITVGAGHYCLDFHSGADPWGYLADSTQKCLDVNPVAVVVDDSKVGAFYYATGAGSSGACRDGSHVYIVCFSWNVWQDDGQPSGSAPGTGVIFAPNACTASSSSDFGVGGTTHGLTAGSQVGLDLATGGPPQNPNVYNYWNVTFGWDSPPGNVRVNVRCDSPKYSGSYGNGTRDTLTWTTADFICQGGSGACGGGGGGGGGGGTTYSVNSTCYVDGAYFHSGGCNAGEIAFGAKTSPGCYANGVFVKPGSVCP